MQDAKIPFGERDGTLFRASEVENGLACGCICPGCRKPLNAANGGLKVIPHFRHVQSEDCVKNYADLVTEHARIFADADNQRSTFEIGLYADNTAICDELFAPGRRTLTPQQYMLANKAEAAFELLDKKADELVVPGYIAEAIAWLRA